MITEIDNCKIPVLQIVKINLVKNIEKKNLIEFIFNMQILK